MYAERIKSSGREIDEKTRMMLEVYIPTFSVLALLGITAWITAGAIDVIIDKGKAAEGGNVNILFLYGFSSANFIVDIVSTAFFVIRGEDAFHHSDVMHRDTQESVLSDDGVAIPGPASVIAKKIPIPSGGNFINIEDFAWDQGEYNTPTVSVFVDLEDVGSVKDRVNVEFTKNSFDLTVIDLHGKSYRLLKNNLEKDIVPDQSTFIVKKNKLVIKLRKVKGEYSFDQWTTLTNKKKKEEVEKSKKDPMGGIMDMMKTMYEDGDENMKKVIGEAMLKSRNGEKPTSPAGGGMDDDFKM
eukprot:gene31339-38716_t